MAHRMILKSRGMQFVEAREGRDLAELLRELYDEQRMTQAQIAERLGVRRATVSRWMAELGVEARWLGPRKAA